MIHLHTYGWNNKLNQLKQDSAHKALFHGRVTIVHRTCYEVISENGMLQCELTGNMMFGKSDFELPCVGDWVIFQLFDENKGVIVDMLPRERILYRKKSGTISDKQAIASYVDKAFIVQSLDDNFNVRRAERFMVQILEEKIKPILILNKADLGFEKQKIEEHIKHIAHQMPVFFTSIHQPQTIHQLRESISEGETVVFVGSSGVGKSSLVNTLCENSVLLTSDISLSTGKGRHTSTRREMVLMDDSGVLIDTPGIREFGLAIDDPDSLTEMLEISDYEESCRFKDCEHINEPGCAVLEAVNSGILDHKVYESYLKLRREAWHFSTSEHEKRKRDKSFSKLIEGVKKHKTNF
ncbi:ribosome small subunit-dependent GTPase A [Dysgonomonas sp. HGC4]|uniref:ribosome small subunit-dependent GTPase A n=1 Tax=Dysgonomonas sp. HGC4 TaxID=1658009 RepID=UPI000682C0FF|nr:ribosome small subunit-dependent GTPase A [Dysgonomonas sp. HGC4]MBD8347278.1 ribosome small subunit-dependent GTPase A [Dysgonomonas sp. HGC4]